MYPMIRDAASPLHLHDNYPAEGEMQEHRERCWRLETAQCNLMKEIERLVILFTKA
jgi:hypothetical protein